VALHRQLAQQVFRTPLQQESQRGSLFSKGSVVGVAMTVAAMMATAMRVVNRELNCIAALKLVA